MSTEFKLKSPLTKIRPWVLPRVFTRYVVGDVVRINPKYEDWIEPSIGAGPFVVHGISEKLDQVWIQDLDQHNLGTRQPLRFFERDDFMSAVHQRQRRKERERGQAHPSVPTRQETG